MLVSEKNIMFGCFLLILAVALNFQAGTNSFYGSTHGQVSTGITGSKAEIFNSDREEHNMNKKGIDFGKSPFSDDTPLSGEQEPEPEEDSKESEGKEISGLTVNYYFRVHFSVISITVSDVGMRSVIAPSIPTPPPEFV